MDNLLLKCSIVKHIIFPLNLANEIGMTKKAIGSALCSVTSIQFGLWRNLVSLSLSYSLRRKLIFLIGVSFFSVLADACEERGKEKWKLLEFTTNFAVTEVEYR